MATQTTGEERVRTQFVPSGHNTEVVTEIKAKTAELIDLCEKVSLRAPRLAALAMTAYEEAAMWAVKAATAE